MIENVIATDHQGRLLKEVIDGKLYLAGDCLVRYNFAFSAGEYPIGIYGIRSFGTKKIRAIRCWNERKDTWNPFSGLFVPSPGRQFLRITTETPLFLVEFNQPFTQITDRVAFRAGKVTVKDAELENMPESMRFEEIDLEDLEILG